MSSGITRLAGPAIILACGLAAPHVFPGFESQIAELLLFIVFAITWDLCGGQMGYNSFGNVLFLGVGMYACAVVQVGLFYDVGQYNAARGGGATIFQFTDAQYLEGILLGLPAAAIAAAIVAAVLGSAVLGMRGQYFAICTLGLGVAAGEIANSWTYIGAGSGMVPPSKPPGIGDLTLFYYYFALGLAVVTFITVRWLLSTRFGLAVNAIRDDEDKAEAMGLPTTRIKVTAWTIAAVFLGIAGGIMGNLVRFIDPIDVAFAGATFGVWMVLMAILGGKGTLWGPVLGAVLFQILKEVFWTFFLGWQRVALGAMIVLIVVFFPQGIIGWLRERFPDRFGHRVEPGNAAAHGEAAE